jgi:hypothetical protein
MHFLRSCHVTESSSQTMSERDGPLSRSSFNGPAIRTFTTTGCAGTPSPTTTCGRSGLDPCTTPADNWAPTTNPYGPTLAEDAQHREDLKAHEAQAASPELPFLGHRPGFPRGVPHTAALTPNWSSPRVSTRSTPNCSTYPQLLGKAARRLPSLPASNCSSESAMSAVPKLPSPHLEPTWLRCLGQAPNKELEPKWLRSTSPELVMSPL